MSSVMTNLPFLLVKHPSVNKVSFEQNKPTYLILGGNHHILVSIWYI